MRLPTDERGYFQIAYDILHGVEAPVWHYTVGQGLLYMPVALLTGAESYYDMVWPITYLNAFVLAPAALALFLWVCHRLTGDLRTTWLLGLLLVVLPLVYLPMELEEGSKAVFTIANFGPAKLIQYYIYASVGLNGMSDIPAMLMVFAAIAASLWLRPGWRYVVVVSALFAFACLIRISNVIFTPLLVFMM